MTTGDDYAFSLDGGAALPDPRSLHQPHGVHGPSRIVDHTSFSWTDAAWRGSPLADATIYELHVGTFTPSGTFDGVAGRLPFLRDLGVTAIELMPVAAFPGARGWGYDGVDLWAVHDAYGGPEGLRRLVDAAHATGIAVVLDVVYNHLGPDGNHLGSFGPYFTDRYRTPWGDALNLDGPDSDEVRAFIVENALMWLRDYHLDGIRLDAVHAVLDTSAVHVVEEISARVRTLEAELGRTLWVIAESDLNDPRVVRPVELGGYGSDAQWSDDFHHALHAVLTGERFGYYVDFGTVADLAAALSRVFVFDGRHSVYRRRRHGRPATGLSGHRFVGYAQNHDQVGNRPAGERSASLLSPGLLRVAAALVFTSPFVPLLFAGEEWGASTPFLYFTDHQDPRVAAAVPQGRRQEFASFGWPAASVPDPQDEATFRRSRLDWSEVDREPHASLLAWYRSLIRLRTSQPALRDGEVPLVRTEYDETRPWLVVRRGPVGLACTMSALPARIPIGPGARRRLLLASSQPPPDLAGDLLRLAGESVVIWTEGN